MQSDKVINTVITSSVKKAAGFIRNGQLVGFPTETVYGLGANVYNEKAVRMIFRVKKRPADNPLIVHISDISQVAHLAKHISKSAETIIERFFPGPITIVLKKNEIISNFVSAGLDTIAVRMPDPEITQKFISMCDVPVAAPSANISGSPSPTTWRHVFNDLNGKISCILKGPKCSLGIESTVVDCTSDDPVVLRPGSISLDDLQELFPQKKIRIHSDPDKVRSPGVKYKHYSPDAKVMLIDSYEEIEGIIKFIKTEKIGFIGTTKIKGISIQQTVSSVEEYARQLFGFLRRCDHSGIKIIFCEKVEEKGIGLALMNRLQKAAEGEQDI